MNKLEKGAQAITEHLKSHPEDVGKLVDRATVYEIAHRAFPDISIEKENMLPTDLCWNIINGRDPKSKMLSDFQNFPHALIAEEGGFRLVGSNYKYEGPVFHRGYERNYGYWKDGTFYREDAPEMEENDLSEDILLRRDDLKEGLEEALHGIPVSVTTESNKILVHFQELLICGVSIEEETNKIFNASAEWAEKTTYHCEEGDDDTWFYYLDTIDECIGECRRLVMFEAQKGRQSSAHKVSSELRRCFSEEVFTEAYRRMMDQADKNASAEDPMGEGERMPYGISKEMDNNIKRIDGGGKFGVGQHFGNGRASKSPYINWYVVSIYYFTDSKTIVLGIEKDRYPKLNQMNPIRYKSREKKSDIAVFYESQKDKLDFKKLRDTFIDVSEQVMVLQGWH